MRNLFLRILSALVLCIQAVKLEKKAADEAEYIDLAAVVLPPLPTRYENTGAQRIHFDLSVHVVCALMDFVIWPGLFLESPCVILTSLSFSVLGRFSSVMFRLPPPPPQRTTVVSTMYVRTIFLFYSLMPNVDPPLLPSCHRVVVCVIASRMQHLKNKLKVCMIDVFLTPLVEFHSHSCADVIPYSNDFYCRYPHLLIITALAYVSPESV